MLEVTQDMIRDLILDVQGLRTNKPCNSVTDIANRIHNIQIDTISVVSRSHNLICFNRFPKYQEGDVWRLERNGKLFEYWSHSMCLMPMDAFPYYSWKMEKMRERKSGWQFGWALKNKAFVDDVYGKVKRTGETKSRDLGTEGARSDGWWDWKKEKRALEYLMTIGKLMVAYREGFQKVYDLTERVIPSGVDTQPMPGDELLTYLIDVVFKSLGVADYRDVKLYTGTTVSKQVWNNRKNTIEKSLDSQVGNLIEEVNFGQRGRYFVHRDYLARLEKDTTSVSTNQVKILSPFDNLLRERHYPMTIWNFNYTLECFVPQLDRKYGYFVLPILDQDEFRGRVDAKTHRKKGLLELLSLYLEHPDIRSEEGLIRLQDGIRKFAHFQGCHEVKCRNIFPKRGSRHVVEILESLNE